jgi:hypothetical protein
MDPLLLHSNAIESTRWRAEARVSEDRLIPGKVDRLG